MFEPHLTGQDSEELKKRLIQQGSVSMFIWNLSGFAEPFVGQKFYKTEKALPGLSDLDQHVECPRSKRTDRVTKTVKEEGVCLGYSKTNGAGIVSGWSS